MDKISVIVPVYKVEEYLSKCIESIINQTHKNLEIILVDDGSPDSCGMICDEYAAKDERIRVIHKENGGQASARNMGLDIATGEYIAFVDSDDYIEPDMYECLYKALTEFDADISLCGFKSVYPNGKIEEKVPGKKPWVLNNRELMENYYADYIYPAPCNKLFKKELWKGICFPEGIFREDAAIMYKVLSKADRAVHTGEAKYVYIQREGSSEHQAFCKGMLVRNKTVDEEYEFIKEKYPEASQKLQNLRVYIRINFIMQIILSGELKKYKNELREMRAFIKENSTTDEKYKVIRHRLVHHWNLYVLYLLLRSKMRKK